MVMRPILSVADVRYRLSDDLVNSTHLHDNYKQSDEELPANRTHRLLSSLADS